MRIEFQLKPLAEVAVWGPEGERHLPWFGLSDGCYWIDLDGVQLFRYFGKESVYVDYFVVRLWEDLLEVLPAVLAAVPRQFVERLHPAEAWSDWLEKATRWMEDSERVDAPDVYYSAIRWWGSRHLRCSHLTNSPSIWIWREGEVVRIRWAHRRVPDMPAWEATAGEYALPMKEFLDAITSFHERFMVEMARRCRELEACHKQLFPDTCIHFPGLMCEHERRRSELGKWLKMAPDDDWVKSEASLREVGRAIAIDTRSLNAHESS